MPTTDRILAQLVIRPSGEYSSFPSHRFYDPPAYPGHRTGRWFRATEKKHDYRIILGLPVSDYTKGGCVSFVEATRMVPQTYVSSAVHNNQTGIRFVAAIWVVPASAS
jgi:hypothetical protein